MRKRKAGKGIELVKVEECNTAKIVVEVDDDLFNAMADAGRQHIATETEPFFGQLGGILPLDEGLDFRQHLLLYKSRTNFIYY